MIRVSCAHGAQWFVAWYLRRLTSSFSFLWHHFSTYIVAILSSVRNLETASSTYAGDW